MTAEPWPTELRVAADRRGMRASFDDGATFDLPARLLRAMTPSAADRGHGGPNFEPVRGVSREVAIRALDPVGRYAVRIAFDDGHASGLYTWDRLHRIGRERAALEAAL